MKSIKQRIMPQFWRESVWALFFIVLIFMTALAILFSQEKRKLDTEIESIISGSLNSHMERNAVDFNRWILNAERALKTAETLLLVSEPNENIQERLERRNANTPDYPTGYLSAEDFSASELQFLDWKLQEKLMQGETVVNIHMDEREQYSLYVIMPLHDDSGMTGVLYIRQQADELFPIISENAIYQYAQSAVVESDGTIVYNTYQPELRGNLLYDLHQYGFTQKEIDEATSAVESPETGSVSFGSKSEYISLIPLAYNDWRLVSVVHAPDVLLRSSTFFREVVVTSFLTVLLAAAAVCIIFWHLSSSKKMLQDARTRNHAYTQRLRAMFEQHTAPKVLFDAQTGEIVDANPAILRYFGYTKSEVVGRNVKEFNMLPPDIQDQKMREGLNNQLMYYAAPHQLKSGETRFLDVYASAILDGDRRLMYAILTDVTDRERYREDLWREKELLRITLQSIGDGVVTTDNSGAITDMNSVAENLAGLTKDSALGKSFAEVFVLQNEETGIPVENPIQKVLETGTVIGLANHTELVNRQGGCIPIADSAAPIQSENGQIFGVVMVFRDVSDEKEHSRKIEFLSYHDSLTDLYNRRYIEEAIACLEEEIAFPVSVIVADVNGLKITNDVFGHETGDALLMRVADLLRENCNGTDLIARWGGDEFVILMPGKALKDAEAVIHRIRDARIEMEKSGLSLSLSLGCACKESVEGDIQGALQQAEENMYQQKLLEGKSYRSAVISTLLATLHEKSDETEAHSKRLEEYCHAMGRKLCLSSRDMDELSLLALLHDIGKVNIPPDILKKPEPLTSAEWNVMRRHPEIGYRIAQATPELAAMADLILSHHERWDGKGYPRGLREEEIPLACRILSVADAYDAMTSDRVYRKAMPAGEAILEIKRNAGTQFDPRMATCLLEIIKEGG